MAVLHGTALPGAMFIFGDVTNLFANFNISRAVFENVTTSFQTTFENVTFVEGFNLNLATAILTRTIDEGIVETEDDLLLLLETLSPNTSSTLLMNATCIVFSYANETNTTAFDILNQTAQGVLSIPVTAGGCACAVEQFLARSSQARCLTGEVFIFGERTGDGILWQIYYFLIITVGVFIVAYFQVSLMQLACERQIQRIRILFYRSVLKQNIGWFDTNSGELTTRLNE